MRSIRYLRGFSLPELLIALLLGLVIAGAALSLLSSAITAAKEQRIQSELSQEANGALAFMAMHLRMSGYASVPSGVETNVFGCDGPFEKPKAEQLDRLRCGASGGSASSVVAVRYEVDRFNAELDATGMPSDCTGKAIGPTAVAGATVTMLENRFFIQTSPTTKNPALYCAGNGTGAGTGAGNSAGSGSSAAFGPQSMADNVELLRITYGSDATTMKTAAEIDAAPASRARKCNSVREVRLCLQMRSDSGATALRTAYLNCDGKLTIPPIGDTRLHRAFAQTVYLRNATR